MEGHAEKGLDVADKYQNVHLQTIAEHKAFENMKMKNDMGWNLRHGARDLRDGTQNPWHGTWYRKRDRDTRHKNDERQDTENSARDLSFRSVLSHSIPFNSVLFRPIPPLIVFSSIYRSLLALEISQKTRKN